MLAFSLSAQPVIDVVYPRSAKNDTIARISPVDKNFIFGSVIPPAASLEIDGQDVKLNENGSFIAFQPVNWQSGYYDLLAIFEMDSTTLRVPFATWPEPDTLMPPELDFPVTLTIDGKVGRNHPYGAYYVFPFKDTQVISTEWFDGYFRIPISGNRSVWVSENYIMDTDTLIDSSSVVIHKLRINPGEDTEELIIPTGRKTLYRVWYNPDPSTFYVELYGVVSHIDLISYPGDGNIIREVIWDQTADNILKLTVHMNYPSWGYDVKWEDGNIILSLRKPPQLRDNFRKFRIAIDPGHGGEQDGAIGPTRLAEKDVNLQVAFALRSLLLKKGWEVVMTRTEDVTTGLNDRIKTAESEKADLLISLHHNALPDGKDPFGKFGSSTHYYHPQSRDFADYVHTAVVHSLEIPDEGLYYHNLALVRPTSMPTILLEAAYMMLPEQEEMLRDKTYSRRLAKAIYSGIKKFVSDQAKQH